MTIHFAKLLGALTITTFVLVAQPMTAAAQDAAPSTTAEAPQTASLTLTFTGIKTATGAVMVGLYDSQAGYDSGKAARKVRIAVSGDSASATLEGLPPGTYAIKAFHDVDGDGKLAANAFGIPSEPYAFSNDARGGMGPPKWAAAAFELKAGSNAQTIHID
jgi:uncharacterized protein (DUF2141 family)